MMKYIFKVADYLLAIPFIVFGFNKFFGFANVAPPTDETAQMFLGAMFSSYLFQLVGVIEIAGGILLLISKTRKLGYLLMLPITVNIVCFHLAHDLPGNGIWIFTMLMTLLSGYGIKDQLKDSLKLVSP